METTCIIHIHCDIFHFYKLLTITSPQGDGNVKYPASCDECGSCAELLTITSPQGDGNYQTYINTAKLSYGYLPSLPRKGMET